MEPFKGYYSINLWQVAPVLTRFQSKPDGSKACCEGAEATLQKVKRLIESNRGAEFYKEITEVTTTIRDNFLSKSKNLNWVQRIFGGVFLKEAKVNRLATEILNLSGANDVNFRDCQGKTALMRACERGDESSVEALLNRGANVDGALAIAGKKRNETIIRKLLEKITSYDTSALNSILSGLVEMAIEKNWETALEKLTLYGYCSIFSIKDSALQKRILETLTQTQFSSLKSIDKQMVVDVAKTSNDKPALTKLVCWGALSINDVRDQSLQTRILESITQSQFTSLQQTYQNEIAQKALDLGSTSALENLVSYGVHINCIPQNMRTSKMWVLAVNFNSSVMSELTKGDIEKIIQEVSENPKDIPLLKFFIRAETRFPGITEELTRKFSTLKTFPKSVGIEIEKLSKSIPEETTVETLFNKLRIYAGDDSEKLRALEIAKKRLDKNEVFLGTPKADEPRSLSIWYDQIKFFLKKLDSVIDADPTKDCESKEQLIQMFGVCGGGWQAELEQMNSELVTYQGTSPEAMAGLVVKNLVDKIISQIHLEYSNSIHSHPDVHDFNRIRTLLKDFLPTSPLEDHLSHLRYNDELISHYFSLLYTKDSIIKALSEAYREEGSALQEGMATFLENNMFVGCKSCEEYETAILAERADLISYFQNKDKPWYQRSVALLTGISEESVLQKSEGEILAAFDSLHQKKVEALAVEKFNETYRGSDGLITPEGLALIAEKMGFIYGQPQ